ncbi:hypothetical protein lerEdw1_007481 [Lerista edwardsae]|nr:hypothetical protein lerEdw1_007481 [Lerista edwardsae]
MAGHPPRVPMQHLPEGAHPSRALYFVGYSLSQRGDSLTRVLDSASGTVRCDTALEILDSISPQLLQLEGGRKGNWSAGVCLLEIPVGDAPFYADPLVRLHNKLMAYKNVGLSQFETELICDFWYRGRSKGRKNCGSFEVAPQQEEENPANMVTLHLTSKK